MLKILRKRKYSFAVVAYLSTFLTTGCQFLLASIAGLAFIAGSSLIGSSPLANAAARGGDSDYFKPTAPRVYECVNLLKDDHSKVEFDRSGRVVNLTRGEKGINEQYYRTNRNLGLVANEHFIKAEELLGFMKGKILDAGTGDGKLVRNLRERGIEAIGVDIALNAEQEQDPHIFSRQDLAFLTFADNSFDTIISTQSVLTYETIIWKFSRNGDHTILIRTLNELKRVLKPGGRMLISPIGDLVNFKGVLAKVGGLRIEREISKEWMMASAFVLVKDGP